MGFLFPFFVVFVLSARHEKFLHRGIIALLSLPLSCGIGGDTFATTYLTTSTI
jgi:hypothetical protein